MITRSSDLKRKQELFMKKLSEKLLNILIFIHQINFVSMGEYKERLTFDITTDSLLSSWRHSQI